MGSYIYLGTNMCVCVCVCVCVCTSHVYVYHLKNTPATAGDIRDAGSVPWLGRSLEGGHGNPVQYSCLENPMDRGARETTDHSHKELDMTDACTHAHHLKEVQFSSVTQSCPTLCDPMNRSTPGLPIHHQLLEFTQTHVHLVGDATQPSHALSSPSPPAPNPSQHQGLFQWVNSSHEVAKVLEFQL